MRLLRLSAIYVILLMMVVGCVSCNSTRRASRRIQNIVREHPELLSQDTVQCDVMISVAPPSDSTNFSVSDFDIIYDNINDIIMDNDTIPAVITPPSITHKTDSGTFTIEKTGDEDFKITYTPDTLQVESTAEVVVPKLTLETHDRSWAQDALLLVVILFVFALFIRTAFRKGD